MDFMENKSLPDSLLAYKKEHSEMLVDLKERWGQAYGYDYQLFEICSAQPIKPKNPIAPI